ncbi:hypothetical protein C6568_11305 [Melaminivora suipulveris]|uniref:Two-component sensor histidine kinase n=1 Tax=Melaminivora suipulveris TaxID=2109913 RepID=A0A2R3QDC9_9BURK|nr:hypothetical protein [Melaminivora suipulveris]AVO49775.1 hypothetical protein C6568_11305 [Melaminivora suipulveris]
MTRAARIQFLALAGLGLLLALLWALSQLAGERHAREMEQQRDAYLLRHLRTAAENYLATGLHLEQMQALQDMIERERAAFAGIVAIDVFSPGGAVLYSTDLGSRGSAVPEPWRAVLAVDGLWEGAAPGQRQVGQRFDSDLGQAAGGIVITLSTIQPPPSLGQWQERGRRLLRWLAAAALAALAAAAALHIGLRRLERPWDEAARVLQAEGDVSKPPATAPLARQAWRLRLAWRNEHRRCQHSLRQLEALDHEA